MPSKKYKIKGLVLNQQTKEKLSGVKVVLWDKDVKHSDLLGEAITTAQGKFTIEFNESHFEDHPKDYHPDVFVRIYQDGRLIHTTERSVFQDLPPGEHAFTFEVADEVAPEGLYRVSGQVFNAQGEPAEGFRVDVYDKDMRSEEFLGSGYTDASGYYEVSYQQSQFLRVEKKQADLLARIPGFFQEPFAESEVLFNAPQEATIDLTLNENVQTGLSEFEKYITCITPLIDSVLISELTEEDLKFLQGETEIPADHLTFLQLAHAYHLGFQGIIIPEFYYGIFRQGITTDPNALFEIRFTDLEAAIRKSIEENIIPLSLQGELDGFQDNWGYAMGSVLPNNTDEQPAHLGQILQTSSIDYNAQEQFLTVYRSYEGDEDTFWNTVIDSDPVLQPLRRELEFTIQTSNLIGKHLPLLQELQFKKQNNGIATARELARFSTTEDWLDILTNPESGTNMLPIPAFINGETDEEKRENYARLLSRQVELYFPTAVLATNLQRDAVYEASDMATFFTLNTDFDLETNNVEAYFDSGDAETGDITNIEGLKMELSAFQRLMNVAPVVDRFNHIKLLKQEGYESATTVSAVPKDIFVDKMKDHIDPEAAKVIHDRASFIDDRLTLTFGAINDLTISSVQLEVTGDDTAHAEAALSEYLPDWRALYGSIDFCSCKHCRSVYSPAAYFVDLLQYLHNGAKNDRREIPTDPSTGETPLQVALKRRPDLAHLPLTCENTNTVLPYIDLVNEIMEHYVAHADGLTSFRGHDTGDTETTTLQANPQHTLMEAYSRLAEAVYPLEFPYHQPLEVIKTYLGHLQSSRFELGSTFATDDSETTQRALTAAFFNLSELEYQIITGEDFDETRDGRSLATHFGYDATVSDTVLSERLAHVPVLLERTGIEYKDLVAILKTRIINEHLETITYIENLFKNIEISPAGIYYKLRSIYENSPISNFEEELIQALVEAELDRDEFDTWVEEHFESFQAILTLHEDGDSCNLDNMFIRTVQSLYEEVQGFIPAETLSKLHRLIRLWKRSSFTIEELDLIFAAFNVHDITPAVLEQLATLQRIREEISIPLESLLTLWGPINTYGTKTLYRKLFLNKALSSDNNVFTADVLGRYLRTSLKPMNAHLQTIQGAFGISSEESIAITEAATIDMDHDMDLGMVSIVYRYVILAKALRLEINQLIALIELIGIDPFSSSWDTDIQRFTDIDPEKTRQFIDEVKKIQQSEFPVETLSYIVTGTQDTSNPGVKKETVLAVIKELRSAFIQIDETYPVTDLVDEALLGQQLALVFDEEVVTRILQLIQGTSVFIANVTPDLDIEIPEELQEKVIYNDDPGILQFEGIMSSAEQTLLESIPGIDAAFTAGIQSLYEQPEVFIQNTLSGVFGTEIASGMQTLLNRPSTASPLSAEEKWVYFYEVYLPFLKKRLKAETTHTQLSQILQLDEKQVAVLLAHDTNPWADVVAFSGLTRDAGASTSVDEIVDFRWSEEDIVPDNVQWEGRIEIETNEPLTFVVKVRQPEEHVQLWINEELVVQRRAASDPLSVQGSTEVALEAGKLYAFRLDYQRNAADDGGVHLSWMTPSQPQSIIPTSYLYPKHSFDLFNDRIQIWNRASVWMRGFQLSHLEMDYFQNHSSDFAGFDLFNPQFDAWNSMSSYGNLRQIFDKEIVLLDIFRKATSTDPVSTLSEMLDMIVAACDWDLETLEVWTSHFSTEVNDFRNERIVQHLYTSLQVLDKFGLPLAQVLGGARLNEHFEWYHGMAEGLKPVVRAKYEEDTWLTVAAQLNDQIRESQQQHLIRYLLARPEIKAWGIQDANGLFDYFLIDVQMDACMDTSRIKQAISSVQLFVTRCFLNLESEIQTPDTIDLEYGVSPAYLSKSHWEWMKNYRVWEANRKVFVYPENWIEPELRDDKSPFFKDLESELLQNDITEGTAETAFRNYLYQLNKVAKLDICGMYEDTRNRMTHYFGRTTGTPYTYYYRRYHQEEAHWSAWEPVDLDIQGIEDGDQSGVHLIPVVWKDRLFLFWPIFIKKAEPQDPERTNFYGIAEKPVEEQQPKEYWEVNMAWSEYKDGNWTPKQVSPEFHETGLFADPKRIFFSIEELYGSSKIKISFLDMESFGNNPEKSFIYSSIYNPVELLPSNYELESKSGRINYGTNWYLYLYLDLGLSFSIEKYEEYYNKKKRTLGDNLILRTGSNVKTYLHKGKNFEIIFDPKQGFFPQKDVDIYLSPFIYQDNQRGYLAVPIQFRIPLQEDIGHDAYELPQFDITLDNGLRVSRRSRTGTRMVDATFLKFETMYHPYADQFIETLNQSGIASLMAADTNTTDFPDDMGSVFDRTYSPSLSVWPTFPKENIEFDRKGAYALYNWELFFHAPLYIATQLSKNGKYAEAIQWFHYIFDPTSEEAEDRSSAYPEERFWKFKPFKNKPQDIRDFFNALNANEENSHITQWRNHPFQPHLVARNRPGAYMKNTVMKYLDTLIAWGDQLFRLDTIESINEATQLYIIAAHILGKRPQEVPNRGTIQAETYHSLSERLDAFSNAKVMLENVFPFSGPVPESTSEGSSAVLGTASSLYFCIPSNPKLISYWDTIADRLFKIRHCMNIDGIERQLSLFEPPIDPALLVQATARGLSIGSVLNDMNSPLPYYRFTYVVQKALELCGEVRSLGSALLTAIEKRDAEELARLRANQETIMLEMVKLIREQQLEEAKTAKENLIKTRETVMNRFAYYQELLGVEEIQRPAIGDTISDLEVDVDISLADTDTTGVKLIPKELEDLNRSKRAHILQQSASKIQEMANIMHMIPNISGNVQPFGTGVSISIGGSNFGAAMSASASSLQWLATHHNYLANRASKMGSFIRRDQEWTFQANQAGKELTQLDTQLTAAEIRISIARQELTNHQQQIDHAKEVHAFMKTKYSNQELYQWMKGETFTIYKQCYQLAYEMAKKAEKAYRLELGESNTTFIKYGFWDSTKEGLMAGDKLHLALRQLESSYINNNKREMELTKHISLKMLNPEALIRLREVGSCEITIPEVMFDLDHPGHYFRRIKSVSITVPCVVGPYTSVNAKLTLMKNSMRKNTVTGTSYSYTPDDSGYDPRFVEDQMIHQQIATSSAQNDSGLFELNFRDERYLPFERSGAISTWKLELPNEFRQFDYDTISDVILHMNYTAREGGDVFREQVTQSVQTALNGLAQQLSASGEGIYRMFSMKQEFPNALHRFLHPAPETHNRTGFQITDNNFPYFLQEDKRLLQASMILKLKDGIANDQAEDMELDVLINGTDLSCTLAPSDYGNLQAGDLTTDPSAPSTPLELNPVGEFIVEVLEENIPDSEVAIDVSIGEETIKKLHPDAIDDILILYRYTM